MRKWLRFFEEVPTAAIRIPTLQMALTPFKGVDQETYRAERADVRPLPKHFYRKMGASGFAPEEVAASLDQLDLTLQRMETALKKGPWLMGRQFTLADAVVLPTVDRLDDLGMAKMWHGYLGVADWYARIRARPSYAAAFYAGSRISDSGVTIAPLGDGISQLRVKH
jgi:glutathione S-transferase